MNSIEERELPELIQKVERFIQHLLTLDFVIDNKKGDSIRIFHLTASGKRAEDILSSLLSNAIIKYELYKYHQEKKYEFAFECLQWITSALSHGIVKEGHGLINKFNDCSKENVDLNEKIEILSDALMKAKERIEELEQLHPSAGSENA